MLLQDASNRIEFKFQNLKRKKQKTKQNKNTPNKPKELFVLLE